MKKKLPWMVAIVALSLYLGSSFFWQKSSYQGYVEARLIYVASPYSGILEVLPVIRGQLVNKGSLLYQLDPNPEALMLRQVQSELSQAQHVLKDLQNPKRKEEIAAIEAQIQRVDAELQLAAIRVHRAKTLYQKQATDKDSVDAALARYEGQKHLKEQYEKNLELAKQGSRDYQIKAQSEVVSALSSRVSQLQWQLSEKTRLSLQKAYVFDTYYQVGEWVAPGKPVLSLLDPAALYIEFYLPLSLSSRLTLGDKIAFHTYDNNVRGYATVSYLSSLAEYLPPLVYSQENQDKLVFRVQADLPAGLLLKPGQPVVLEVHQ